jgi:hypothetical protein
MGSAGAGEENFLLLSKQCQDITQQLGECHDPAARKVLLTQLRHAISKLERMALAGQPDVFSN